MAQTIDNTVDHKFANQYINLAQERLGTKVLFATDDFFAEKENLIKSGRGIFIADKYTDRGKWMDGWESRRKRVEGHDWCDLKLGACGIIRGVDIDTNFFLGNHPPFASLEACNHAHANPDAQTVWTEILAKSPLQPGLQNLFEIKSEKIWTHLRLHIYPDGGVARFKVFGEVKVDWTKISPTAEIDLLSVYHQGKALHANDMFFSSKDNLNMPGRGANMGDGWETKRKRTPGHDWCLLALGHRGTIGKVEVDTAHFKGNYPDRCSLEVCDMGPDFCRPESLTLEKLEQASWQVLLPEVKLQADHQHYYEKEVKQNMTATHARFRIYPDGGVSRLRLIGKRV